MRRATMPLVTLASTVAAASVAAARRRDAPAPLGGAWRAGISNHKAFAHDSLDSLGYDWGRVADPAIAPRYPLKIYLPRTTDDVVRIVEEARSLGERLTIRSKGHSSNDLVVTERGGVLLTQGLSAIGELDEAAMTVTVGAGVVSAALDDWLAARGYGLPVIGSHSDITVGGFASVGGVSPASHRFGLFVDTIERLEYVNWEGEVVACGRGERPDHFYRVLAGTGRQGVITSLTCRIIRVDKYRTVLENDQTHYRELGAFIAGSSRALAEPGDALFARGIWIDLARRGRGLAAGQFSAYRATPEGAHKRLRDQAAYGYYHRLGWLAGRAPAKAGAVLKYAGTVGVLASPKYATMKHIEMDTDKTLDATVGDPTRWLVMLAPLDRYAALFRRVNALMTTFRERHGCFTFIALYVKGIHSEYLAQGGGDRRFCEMIVHLGINPEAMTGAILDGLVSQLDDICIEEGAFRYMHTKTVKDPERRRRVDPNAFYAEATSPVAVPAD